MHRTLFHTCAAQRARVLSQACDILFCLLGHFVQGGREASPIYQSGSRHGKFRRRVWSFRRRTMCQLCPHRLASQSMFLTPQRRGTKEVNIADNAHNTSAVTLGLCRVTQTVVASWSCFFIRTLQLVLLTSRHTSFVSSLLSPLSFLLSPPLFCSLPSFVASLLSSLLFLLSLSLPLLFGVALSLSSGAITLRLQVAFLLARRRGQRVLQHSQMTNMSHGKLRPFFGSWFSDVNGVKRRKRCA